MSNSSAPSPKTTEEESEKRNKQGNNYQHYKDYVSALPTVDGLTFGDLYLHEDWYVPMFSLIGTLIAQQEYQATYTDILLATVPKAGYWHASLERPNNVLFVKYEELKEYPEGMLKRIAEFVGFPFTNEEEKNGVVKGIISLCKFDNLKNAKGKFKVLSEEVDANLFFRQGKVDDWLNHLSPSMSKIMDDITESKFVGSGLSF